MKKMLAAIFLFLATVPALGQSGANVRQSGNVTPGHVPMWTTNGVIQDGGTAAQGFLSSLGVTNNGGPGICINSAPITQAYNRLCLSAATSGTATLSLQALGGATPQTFAININGVSYPFPGVGTGTVVGPSSAINNSIVLFNGTTGQIIKDSAGIIPNATTFSAGVTLSSSLVGTGTPASGSAVPNNPFGGSWNSLYNLSLTDSTSHAAGANIAFSVSSSAIGSTVDSPAASNYAGYFVSTKQSYLTSVIHGEIDGIYSIITQGKFGDSGGFLADITKVNGGTGSGLSMEFATKIVNSSGVEQQQVHGHLGWADVSSGEYKGFTAEAWTGTLTSAFVVDTFNFIGTPAWTNILTARRARNNANIYFQIDGNGAITTGVWSGTAITVAKGGTNCTAASITCFNNITGYTASGATGTTSTNLVFSASPTLTGNAVITGGTLTDGAQALNITATQPTTPTGDQNAFTLTVVSAGTASQINRAGLITYSAGYTGSSATTGLAVNNGAAGTGTTMIPASGSLAIIANMGLNNSTVVTTTGTNIGTTGRASGGDTNVGLVGIAQVAKTGAGNKINIGGAFSAYNTTTGGSTAIQIGLWASLNQTTTPTTSAAFIADNGAQSASIALFQAAGVTVASVGATGIITSPSHNLSGTSNQLVFQSAGVTGTISWAPATSNKTITLPNGTTDFTATGGTSQVVKQTSAGAAFTVARLACADLSDAAATCSSATGETLVIGTTAITSGTTTRILYDNAGVLGEYTITGTGTVVAMQAGPTFTGTVTIPTPFTLGAVSVTATGTQLNYLNAATGTTGTASTNVVFSTSPTITTAVLNGTITGTSQATANTASTLVMRDASGNFSAGTITANINGTVGATTPTTGAFTTVAASTSVTVTSASAVALTVGLNGATNPAFAVDASTASQAAGFKITGAATGGTVALVAIDSGSNTNLTLNAKGSGTIGIGSVSTGAVTITPALTLSAALTYGGVTLSNSVTGTGSMALSASPTFTGTLTAAVGSFSSTLASTAHTITSASANALAVGRLGATTPAFNVDASTATSITGIQVKSAATTGGVDLAAIGETNVNLRIDAAGSGTIIFAGTSTGAITLTRATTMSAALTYGGVALSNAVTGTGNMVLSAGPTFTGTLTASVGSFSSTLTSTAHTITSASATALTVGLNGATNPALQIDASTASSTTGIKIKSAAAAGGVAMSVITSGTNENLTIDAAGSGTIIFAGTSTGAITLTRATTLSAALTYGGVTLSNAVTGTGNMVLSASPTLTANVVMTGGTLGDGAQVLSITATNATTPTGDQNAIAINVTSAGSASQINRAALIQYLAGYTGSSATTALAANNGTAGTGTTMIPASGSQAIVANMALNNSANGTTTGTNIGSTGRASAGDTNVGLVGISQVAKTGAGNKINIGVAGSAYNTVTGGSTAIQIGGWFSLNQTTTPTVSAALIADNGAQTTSIFLARDNGTTVVSIDDGGTVTMTSLTAAAGTPNSICQNNATKEIVVNAALTCTVSSLRFKHDFVLLNKAMTMVMAIQTGTFFYNDNNARQRIGFSSEQLATVDRRLADGWDSVGPRSIDQNAILAITVKAVQELKADNDNLRQEVEQLKRAAR